MSGGLGGLRDLWVVQITIASSNSSERAVVFAAEAVMNDRGIILFFEQNQTTALVATHVARVVFGEMFNSQHENVRNRTFRVWFSYRFRD